MPDHHPGLTAYPAGLEVYGVNYSGGITDLSGGLGAALPAGNNVTVKLASWLSLVFENVTSPGFVSANLTTFPSLPGVLPLQAFSLGTHDVAYTGNIRVNVTYAGAGISSGQAGEHGPEYG